MGKKIFVTYKYGDTDVYPLKDMWSEVLTDTMTRVRDYVTELETILHSTNDIYKGEKDDQPLNVQKTTIQTKLKDKIFDSSLTIVMISPNMKNPFIVESDQWIPWEISYSLGEYQHNGRISKTNAMLAIVLPNRLGQYDYYIEQKTCCTEGCRYLKTENLFKIIKNNMFNEKKPINKTCTNNSIIYYGHPSYIYSVKWSDFIVKPNHYFDIALYINSNISDYDITKRILQEIL